MCEHLLFYNVIETIYVLRDISTYFVLYFASSFMLVNEKISDCFSSNFRGILMEMKIFMITHKFLTFDKHLKNKKFEMLDSTSYP